MRKRYCLSTGFAELVRCYSGASGHPPASKLESPFVNESTYLGGKVRGEEKLILEDIYIYIIYIYIYVYLYMYIYIYYIYSLLI